MIDIIILFFILTPGILFRLPFKKYTSALLHACLFTILFYVTRHYLEGADLTLVAITKDAIINNPKDKNLRASQVAAFYK